MPEPAPCVVVTGAAGGIGAATVAELVERGARVLAVDITPEVARLESSSIVTRVADITDLEAFQQVVDSAIAAFGRIDALFNNAGILGVTASVVDYPLDIFQRVFDVNVRGVFNGMRVAIPALRASGGGTIVNTASTGALVAAPFQAPYVASKHAVLGLTRSAALEFAAEGIRVNALCPGATDTRMLAEVIDGWHVPDAAAIQAILETVTPTGRMARAEEIAQVAAWLLLEAPTYLTGTSIAVDGAQTAR